MSNQLYTVAQAAQALGITRSTLFAHMATLPAPGILLTPRQRVFTDEDIAANRAYFDSHVDSRNRGGRGKKRKINPAS